MNILGGAFSLCKEWKKCAIISKLIRESNKYGLYVSQYWKKETNTNNLIFKLFIEDEIYW